MRPIRAAGIHAIRYPWSGDVRTPLCGWVLAPWKSESASLKLQMSRLSLCESWVFGACEARFEVVGLGFLEIRAKMHISYALYELYESYIIYPCQASTSHDI